MNLINNNIVPNNALSLLCMCCDIAPLPRGPKVVAQWKLKLTFMYLGKIKHSALPKPVHT